MDTFQAIKARRAVKFYDNAHVMSAEEEKQLMELAMLSPTSFNIQHWRVVNVKDQAIRQQIQEAAWGQEKVTGASMLLVLCADVAAWSKSPERYWDNAPDDVKDAMVGKIIPFYENQPQLARDEAIRSVGIMSQTIMLAAQAMGYDSCPMIGFEPEAVAKLINLPDDHVIGMMITVGKGTQDPLPKPTLLDYKDVVLTDSF